MRLPPWPWIVGSALALALGAAICAWPDRALDLSATLCLLLAGGAGAGAARRATAPPDPPPWVARVGELEALPPDDLARRGDAALDRLGER